MIVPLLVSHLIAIVVAGGEVEGAVGKRCERK